MRILATIVLLAAACQERSEPQRVSPPDPVAEPPEPAEPAPAPVKKREPPRELTKGERALVGTWIVEVDERATQSKSMSGMVMLGLQPGKDLVTGTMEAIEADRRVPTSCIWLELSEDLTGFRNECALFNGQPSALDKTDPLTGKKSRFGIPFEWQLEGKKTVAITLDDPLVVTRKGGDLEVKRWDLTLGKKKGDKIRVEEEFPEHDLTLPVQFEWEIFPGRFLE